MGDARVFIGWDAAELRAWNVAASSLRIRASIPVTTERLALTALQARGLYWRETREDLTEVGVSQLFDVISGAPMSTGHAIARFLIPLICDFQGWALFVDGDVLFLADVADLFALADPRYAVQVVQHPPMPEAATKKAGQTQSAYGRKNWSSVMLFNCGHPANQALTPEIVNAWPGRDLHAFKWLSDDLIGALPAAWNYLVHVTEPVPDPIALAHYTLGTPDLPQSKAHDLDDEWWHVAKGVGYGRLRPATVGA